MSLCTQILPSYSKLSMYVCVYAYAMEYDYDPHRTRYTLDCHFTRNAMVNNMLNIPPSADFLYSMLSHVSSKQIIARYVHVPLSPHKRCEIMLQDYFAWLHSNKYDKWSRSFIAMQFQAMLSIMLQWNLLNSSIAPLILSFTFSAD